MEMKGLKDFPLFDTLSCLIKLVNIFSIWHAGEGMPPHPKIYVEI